MRRGRMQIREDAGTGGCREGGCRDGMMQRLNGAETGGCREREDADT